MDPHPDIHILFKEYDKKFFKGILSHNNVDLSWSDRLIVTIGITYDKEE